MRASQLRVQGPGGHEVLRRRTAKRRPRSSCTATASTPTVRTFDHRCAAVPPQLSRRNCRLAARVTSYTFKVEAMALIRLICLSLCLCASVASFVIAQAPEPMWPGAKYDPAIPTLRRWSATTMVWRSRRPIRSAHYLQALAKAAPTRTRLFEYARTWEGRPLWVMVIGSPERIAKLDQVKADSAAAGRPADAVRRRRRSARERAAGRDLAVAWRARQRDLVGGCGTVRGVSPARVAGRRQRRPRCCANRWC